MANFVIWQAIVQKCTVILTSVAIIDVESVSRACVRTVVLQVKAFRTQINQLVLWSLDDPTVVFIAVQVKQGKTRTLSYFMLNMVKAMQFPF